MNGEIIPQENPQALATPTATEPVAPEVFPEAVKQPAAPIHCPAPDTLLSKIVKRALNISTGSGIGIAGLLVAVALPIGQCLVENHQAELRHKETNVQIAVGILSEKTKEDKDGNIEDFPDGQKELRRWALRQLNHYTEKGDQIQGDAAEALIKGGTTLWGSWGGYSGTYDYTFQDSGTYYDDGRNSQGVSNQNQQPNRKTQRDGSTDAKRGKGSDKPE